MRALQRNRDIVIKSADKGGAVVVLDKEAYLTEAYRQLDNPKYYKRLSQPIYLQNRDNIIPILDTLQVGGYITNKQLLYLIADMDNCKARTFYLLPKIHKKPENWTIPGRMPEGRPIVSDCMSESYRVSEYIDSFIAPLAKQHPSYLKDTYDFVDKIRGQSINANCFLVTGDVCSLYTNMNIERIVDVVQQAFNANPVAGRPSKEIIDLLKLTLKNNDFEFNDEFFLQIHGTAMGKRYAPSLANLYLVDFDHMAKTGFRINPDFFIVSWTISFSHGQVH